jgi:uncharacterized iron-regulated membrane protein
MKAIVTLALLLATVPVWGVMYKWVDADGKVHYSDQAPPEGAKQQETVKVKVPPPAPAAPQPDGKGATPKAKTTADQDMDFRKRRLAAAEADAKRQQDADAAADKAKKCEQAKSRATALQYNGRITKYGPNGEQIYLNDDEIAKEIVDARKAADSWCK